MTFVGVESRDLKFLEVIQQLGEHLTNDDITIRAKAIAYLGAVLENLSPKTLTRTQIPFVREFLCDRLEDETGVKETSGALTALAKQKSFTKEDTTGVVDA